MKRVMVFGTFDFFHLGHLQFFRQAKKYGDYLIVVVARDHRATKAKGQKLIHSEKERLELIKHIRLVDVAMLGDRHDVYKVIKTCHPDVIALGYDQTAFVDGIKAFLTAYRLRAKVVRLKPYKPETHKSSMIKSHRAKRMI